MKRIISFIMAITIFLTTITVTVSKGNNKTISDSLLNKIESEKELDVLITFEDEKNNETKVDLSGSKSNQVSQRKAYIKELKENASLSQKKAFEIIEENSDRVKEVESFYITNSIRLKGDTSLIKEVIKLDNIVEVVENGNVELKDFDKENQNHVSGDKNWDLKNTNVLDVRDKYKLFGTDIVIGFLDSGVDLEGSMYKNDEIYDNWRGHTEGISTSWYDVFGESEKPISSGSGHGTAVVSLAVGKNIGVAPKAKWISARAFKGKTTNNSNILKAAQWFLAPGGRAELAPNIINNSWGKNTLEKWFDPMIDAWINAGIIPIFASGNKEQNNKLGTIDYPASNLKTISVGAVDRNNNLAYFSKRGPSPLDDSRSIIKPELVAPGVDVYASDSENTYSLWKGTSLATPNVTGIMALILEANRNIDNAQMKNILTLTAKPLTDSKFQTSPNMGYGYGLVDALKAVELSLKYNKFSGEQRISGKNRSETSLEIANKFYDTSEYVYVTNQNSFSDGLSMGSLTKFENGPLLLIPDHNLSVNTKVTLNKLQPKKIIIIGGVSTIGKSLEEELKSYAEVERVSGKNRIETSLEIARRTDISNKKEVFLVNGYIEADSINIVSVSSRDGIPVIFTAKDSISSSTKNMLKSYGIEKVTIVGGDSTVSLSVENELNSIGIKEVKRISGTDRFLTGTKVNENYYEEYNPIFFANGYNVADALAIGPVLGKLSAPLQIVPQDYLTDGVISFYSKKNITDFYILGGTSSVTVKNLYNIFDMITSLE
ncbi:S8 family serine peptidase [Lagierella massiliensis]|uniref:S8 family serine peptidase n=1 Tax=Lagierella massiliensis TaxID=1689303 RepID=UPI0006D7E238|nr:S8 family serine peptidase [Lagierella massiliensis]